MGVLFYSLFLPAPGLSSPTQMETLIKAPNKGLLVYLHSDRGGTEKAVKSVCGSLEGMNRGDLIIAQAVWQGLLRWR